MPRKRTLSAQEAADELGVSKSTLYTYVSRGLIRSREGNVSTRERRYYAEDVEKLVARKTYRRDPTKVAEDALHWGAPMLDSAVTLIADGQLYYRGVDATELARSATLEEVALLLWTEKVTVERLREVDDFPEQMVARLTFAENMPFAARMATALALASAEDLVAYDLRPAMVARTGMRISRLLARAVIGIQPPIEEGTVSQFGLTRSIHRPGIAAQLAVAWGCPSRVLLIDMALILCVDHELNASSFAARVAASAGANPYAVVAAGLAVLTGYKHGGNTERVEAFLRETDNPAKAAAARLRRGDIVPGFGHPLYPDGDPRAAILLYELKRALQDKAILGKVDELIDVMAKATGIAPNIDLMLAVLSHALDLPDGSPLALFAIGRSVGWIAHALEQYQSDELIRPRARYVGRLPGVTRLEELP